MEMEVRKIRNSKVIEDKDIKVFDGILHRCKNIDLIPSSMDLSSVKENLVNAMNMENILKTYYLRVKEKYDYILIDSMPSLGVLTINSLASAKFAVVPV